MVDLWQEIYGTIRRNKLRTVLTGFAVAWGIFMLIVLLGAGNGIIHAFEQNASERALNSMRVFPGWTTKSYDGLKEGRRIKLDNRDVDDTQRLFPDHVGSVGATLQQGAVDVSFGKAYRVVGLYNDQNENNNSEAFIPFSTLQLIYGKGDELNNIIFTTEGLTDEPSNEAFEEDYRRAIAANHRFAPDDDGAIWIWNRFTSYLHTQAAAGILRTAIWVIGIFTLLSGIVGVSNIMLITVKERTHEFGIRKALGAKPSSILRLIIVESVAITTFFGYVGMVAGIAATEWMDATFGSQTVDTGMFQAQMFQDPTVDLGIALQATVTLIVAGTLAGFFPARKATKIRPIEALRAE